MPWNRKQIRVLFALVAFGVLLFVGLQNLGTDAVYYRAVHRL